MVNAADTIRVLRRRRAAILFTVMAGLDPAIHVSKAWMPGTRPGMTRC